MTLLEFVYFALNHSRGPGSYVVRIKTVEKWINEKKKERERKQ
jgi:hypothetical protein